MRIMGHRMVPLVTTLKYLPYPPRRLLFLVVRVLLTRLRSPRYLVDLPYG